MRDENERDQRYETYRETGRERFEDFLFWIWLAAGIIGFACLFFA